MQGTRLLKILPLLTAISNSLLVQVYAGTDSSTGNKITLAQTENTSVIRAKENSAPAIGTLRRSDGTDITYYALTPPGKSFPAILYLHGSGCSSVDSIIPYFTPFLEKGFGILTLEKKGVKPHDTGAPCSKEYLESNDRDQRINDALLLLSNTKHLFPNWDGRTVIMGGSEGGAIAPEIAFRYPQSSAVVSLAGGGMGQAWELKKLKEKELSAAGASQPTIKEELQRLDKKFEEIRKSPTSTQTWDGEDNTYKRWASYLWYNALGFFVKLGIPVYVAHGTSDTNAPIESADIVRDRFASLEKHNLTYKRYEGLDHHWTTGNGENQTPRVIGDFLDWVLQTIPPDLQSGTPINPAIPPETTAK